MLHSFSVKGYRGLEVDLRDGLEADLSDLGPVTLLLGPSGSGKTALLEALRLYADGGTWERLSQIAAGYGVGIESLLSGGTAELRGDLGHLQMTLGWEVGGLFTAERTADPRSAPAYASVLEGRTQQLATRLSTWGHDGGAGLPPLIQSRIITPAGLQVWEVREIWNQIMFHDPENQISALFREIAPNCVRIGLSSEGLPIAQVKGHEGPVPLHLLGSQLVTVFHLALAGAWLKEGRLLLIDTLPQDEGFASAVLAWLVDRVQSAGGQIVLARSTPLWREGEGPPGVRLCKVGR